MSELSTAPRPIRSVLIANRGEIACRVIATCRRLGLRAIAVHSDADANALHVRMADESHRLGPAAARQSYLDMDAVLEAARASGADALHPGYGFLSENATFVRRCEAAGLAFVGPAATAVAAMGSKIAAKRIAEEAGVPTVPGYHGDDQSPERLAEEAQRIGFPVLVKASAGGGGRGMRLAETAEAFAGALDAAIAEATAAFGDGAVLLERYVARPRHLEVQLVGDTHGNLVHLFERDCSVQRNNQKVLEEAPAPNLDEAVRDRLYEAALKLGRAIGYSSAGTVEFIMEEGGGEPYFLEMNTRLQVEHPVTEEITGIDLVEWQLRVAAGLKLPCMQDEIRARGHAIEARLAAERPEARFQPATGRVSSVAPPPGLRFDTGLAVGTEIGLSYDSMLAKLIAWGPDRETARIRLVEGLERLSVVGVATNQAFLHACVAADDFARARATTRFIPENFPNAWAPDEGALARLRALACAVWARDLGPGPQGPWGGRDGFRMMGARRPARCELGLVDDYGAADVTLSRGPNGLDATVGGETVALADFERSGFTNFDGRPVVARTGEGSVQLSHGGLSLAARISLAIEAPRSGESAADRDGAVTAPLPGLVTRLAVVVGQRVEAGETVAQIEAMKLVHTLAAPISGTISSVSCAEGDTVSASALLIEVSPDTEE